MAKKKVKVKMVNSFSRKGVNQRFKKIKDIETKYKSDIENAGRNLEKGVCRVVGNQFNIINDPTIVKALDKANKNGSGEVYLDSAGKRYGRVQFGKFSGKNENKWAVDPVDSRSLCNSEDIENPKTILKAHRISLKLLGRFVRDPENKKKKYNLWQ